MSDYFKKRMEELGLSEKSSASKPTNNTSEKNSSTNNGTVRNNNGNSNYFKNRYKELGLDKDDEGRDVDDNYINSFFKDAEKYVKSAQSIYDSMEYNNSVSSYESRKQMNEDLSNRAFAIKQYFDKNKDTVDEDTYNTVKNYLDNFSKVASQDIYSFYKKNQYYSSFGSEGEYNNYLASVDYGNKSAEELEAYKGSIGNEVQQHEYAGFYVNALKEGKSDEWIRKNMPDYAKAYDYIVDKYDIDTEIYPPAYIGEIIYEKTMSLPMTEKNPVLYYDQNGAVTLDNLITVKKTEGKIAAIQSDNKLKTSYDELMTYDQDIGQMEAAMAALSAKDQGATVYPEDMEAYKYIINKYGIDTEGQTNASIKQLIYENYLQLIDGSYIGQQKHKSVLSGNGYDWDELMYYHNWNKDRERQSELKKSYEMVAEDYPVLSTAANLFTGPIQAAEFAGDILERATHAGKDKHSAYKLDNIYDNNANAFSETVSGTVTENIKNKVMDKTGSEFWSDLAGTAYGGVTSAVQSYVTQAMLGGVGGSLILASQAASSKYIEGIRNGQTTGQAMTVGVISGVAEYFTEKITWEKLMEIDTSWDTATVGSFLKSLFKNSANVFMQGMYEGGEEVVSALASTIADEVIGQDKSSIATAIRQYKMDGLSDTDAKKQATQDWWTQLLDSAIGGFIGGAFGGGVQTAVQTGIAGTTGIINNSRENKWYKSKYDLPSLIDEALEIDPDNELAKKIKEKVSSGKNVSGAQIKSLVQSNKAGIVKTDIAAIESAAKNRLADLGETGDINAISLALAKQAAGEKLSTSEQKAISDSEYGLQVANELNPDNIRSGETDSAWAEKIDTNIINPVEYSRLVAEAQIAQEGAETVEGISDTSINNVPQDAKIKPEATPVAATSETDNVSAPEERAQMEEAAETSDNENVITIEEASKKYGAQAGAMLHTYHEGQDVAKYDAAYEQAYNMGNSGVSLTYAMNSESTSYLTETQRELAYRAGAAASDTAASEKEAANKKLINGKTGRKKGVVKGEGVTISDLKKTFNDRQNTAYKLLSTYAEATGVDIVLYRSEANAEGRYEGAQGKYKHSEPGTIYIDINAGLSKIKDVNDLAKYTMLRTFAHEFTHFIENWNPVQYNVFRKVVFETLTERGENVRDLIEAKQAANPGMSYDKASREVVAEAMTDILPDANFVEKLANNHKTIFEKLLEKLKEFVNTLREYFNSIGHNRSREANALKEQVGDAVRYVESIVNLFDNVAVQAVENYQATVAEDEVITEVTTVPKTTTSEHGFTVTDNVERGSLEITFNEKPSQAVRDVLRENSFRWHREKKLWYGYAEREAITEALNKAYEAETVDKTTETKPSDFETAFWNATQEERDEVVEAINANINLTHVAPTEIREQVISEEAIKPIENIEEATTNGTENVDNGQTVLGSDADGQRASRLLDESQVEDVQGTSSGGDTVTDSSERGSETSRDDDRTDTADRPGRSEGVSEVRDLRRDDELTSEQEAETKAEQLHEEVEKQIEQKSTEKPKGNNFVIGDSLNLPTGEKARFRANVDAIRLIKQLATEDRYATAAEQEILSKYVGWGGLGNAFGELRYNRDTHKSEMTAKDGWVSEFEELRSLVDEGVITEQEYKDMSASTKNAHYTSVEIIKAMYDGLKQLGFKGGRMLEPSSGVGNFVGAMPIDMTAKVNSWTMVELDRITGQIAKYLYPNSDVRIQGFETANIPDNYMDVAIGNVPFGNFGVVDRTYPKRVTKSIHNYFFAKSIDKVRPGGIVMFITSSFTMDSKDAAIRQYMMERADLLGAIRLPNTSFKDNAGTEVVTDILILKKREGGTEYAGEDFLNADYDYNHGSYVSNYFKEHPEMVLGTPVTKSGMYGSRTLTYEPLKDRGTIDDQIREAFKNIKGEMTYTAKLSPEKTNFAVERATKKTKAGGFVVNKDGSISRSENGQLVKYDTDGKTAKRIAGMLGIRDTYRTLANNLQQGVDTKIVKQSRKALNTAYDSFVKEYGYINSPANRKAIDSDPDSYSILSLENYDVKKKTATKADIFTKDTISANKTVTHVDSVSEGVIASLNLTGGVDTELIAKLTSRTVEDVTNEVIASHLAFKTRNGTLVARESYLAGNVRAKLREAESLVPYDKDYAHNIEELRRVIPKDIPYNEIYITPGATFIPNEVYADFIAHMLGGRNNPNSYSGPDVEVGRTVSGEFKINLNNKRLKASYYNTQTWGTARKSFLELIDAMMGSRTVKVNDTVEGPDGKKISVLNEAETEAANEKVKAIQKEFEDWLWKDETRRTELAKLYNETFNAIVNPKYDGSNLTVNGINADFKLREHQANAVHRIISSGGNTLLAHRVGAGKTLEMAAAAMKLRELGVVKKPVFVVPKALVAQWGVEFHSYFPASRILVADDKSFTPANRKVFTNKIANGDYDAVIVSYEQFEKIPMSAEYQTKFYEEQIDEIINAIAEEKAESRDGKGLTVKEMEKKKAQLEKKLKELTSKPKDEDNIDFEMLGIDSLFVDEAHNFKNLEYVSKMTNVAGLGSAKGSQRAFDLYTKVRYLQSLNGGRGIVFATATPVMNSMVELYIMQRYLQPDVLEQLGLKSFDAWAKQFGEVVNKWEINPSGTGMRQKQVFANFRNLNELQLLFRSFSDVLTDVPGLKIPKMKGGAVKIVECEPGQFQKDYMLQLQKRAEVVKSVDPSIDNMLKITSDGRKVSYTQRMIDPSLPYEAGSKIYRCCENVLAEYKDSSKIKGTQIIFCDMATPKGSDKSKADNTADNVDDTFDEGSAKLYDDMRAYLVKNGIPAKEIAFIHEADSDAKRKQLFADVNDGKVRVLIGSTGKMGVGMNAQKRIVAIHHLDAPWRPGDVEQRDGRAFRQKNINEEVSKYVYVTKGSFDSRLWDILDRKQHFIGQIMNGEDVGRTAEDTGEVTLSAAEVKALASGNPLIEEQTKLTDAIKKLENLQKAYNSSIRLAKTKLSDDEQKIAYYTTRIANIREDIKSRVDTYSEGKFSMNVGGQVFTDKKDAGVALATEIAAKTVQGTYVTVGTFAGFELKVLREAAEYKGLIQGKATYKFNVYLSNTTRMVNHIGEIIAGFENQITYAEQSLTDVNADLKAQQEIIAKPFEKAEELAEKRTRFNEVMELLAPKTEQQHGSDSEGDVQYQARSYLDEDALYQQRTSTLTNREILAMATDNINIGELTAGEQDALNIFKKHLTRLEELQEQRAEQGRLYKEQQFGEKVDRKAAAETLNRMHILDDQIKAENDDLFTIEEKAVLRKVLEKARKVIEQTEREHGQEILKRWRDRRNNAAAIKKYRERLRADVDELSDWVLHPNNKDVVKHIPDALKNSVIPFLSSINFMSKQSLKGGKTTAADKEFIKRLNDLKATLKPHLNVEDMYNAYTDLPPNFMDRLDTFISVAQDLVDKNNGEFIINQMTAEELKELSQVVRALKEYIKNFNKFHVNAMFQHVYEAGDDTILTLGQMKSAGPHTGNISNFVLWQQMRPAYAFERFGDGGKAIYDGLRRGQATLAFNTKKIQEFAENAYTAAEVKAWEKEIKEIRIGGNIIKMPVSTIMSFYELSKRPQALGHILGEGIRVATFKANGKKISDVGHTLTSNDVKKIIATLTPRQKEVADNLQKFMQEQGGKWGNYVSVKRFGEELFGEEHYFPINSDGRHLSVNAEEHPAAASLYALLNMGFTKSTQEGAINRIVLYSIFDVFANHMASMAQYNAFALPVVDAIKWFNYQQKSEPDENGARAVLSSVRDQMDRVYGVPEETRPGSGRQGYAQTFVINILKAFNGTEAQGVPTDTTGLNSLRRYNMAQVAYNFRVVMQQPMAITRAAQILDYGSILKGMKLKPKAIQINIAEMQKYSGIAAWKSLGFYDVNISRGLTEIIKHNDDWLDKVGEVGMWGAEKADLMTWAAMWSAAKQEVIYKQKLTPKSEGFYEAVTELFEEVIYKTQVVDSVLTKNEFLRSKGLFARAMGSFMSEPTTTASMLVDAYDKYHADIQRGFSKQKAWQRNRDKIVRTAYVYAISAITLAAVQAIADAFRDDDDYEKWYEKWLDAFIGNFVDELLPFNKLPIMSDIYDLAKEILSIFGVDTYGNPPQSIFMQWYDSLIKGTEILYDRISGADTNYTWYGGAYKLLQAVAGMTGLPMAAATRELITAWNNTVGSMAPSLKVKTYDPGDQAEIKYAYQDGYLTAEEATEQLIEKGVVDTENEAYFLIAEWGDPDGSYSRYDKLYDAARNGGDFDAAMDELVSHGYTEKDVLSQLKSEIGTWYKEGKITKQQAIDMLTKYFDMDSEEITATANKWSSKVVTGIEFDDIKDEYLSGNITASRAAEMYALYGGYTKDEARQKVAEWDFEEKHGYKYSNRGEQFKEGNISATELINIMVSFDGKTKDEARSDLVAYTKSGYKEGYFSRSKAIDIMDEYGGLTADEAEAKVQHVDFQREYPEYELTEAQVTSYYDELEQTGLGVPEYAKYVEGRKGIKGVDADGDGKTDTGSVKSQVMIVIDSLPITTEQKDALYYLNGWAASRIYEAPWH